MRSSPLMVSALVFAFVLVLVLVLFLAPSPLQGQAIQSSILGTVTDPTGGVVPGAEVTVTQEGTNFERAMVTDETGDYRISGLLPGRYSVVVSLSGFKTYIRSGVDLNSSQIKRVDAVLEIGEVSQSVTIRGDVGKIETETATLANVKTNRDFIELPLSTMGRGWANITNVTAGVQSKSGFEVNGARDTANNFTADGISVNDVISSRNTANGFAAIVDTFQEVKIMTATPSAEFPQVAQFTAVTRSGSNQVHGGLYWGNFNSYFSARKWSDAGTSKPSFTNHNMFSVTNGGPVYIPGLYDGRDRTFYFYSYGGARYRIGARKYVNVPSAALKQGDFSALLPDIKIIDPVTGQPFEGNKIPASRISPVSKAVQDLIYPEPNFPGVGKWGLESNYYGDPGGRYDSDVHSARIDHKVSDKNQLFVRVGLTINNKDSYPGVLKSGYGQGAWRGNHPGRNIVVSDTHTFTSSLVNEAKIGFQRDFGYWFDPNSGQDVVSQIGLQGINNPQNDPAIGGMPSFSIGGVLALHGTDTWANGNFQATNTYQLIDNLSWYRGRHTFKMGVDIRRNQVNDQVKPQSMRGAFSFDDRLSGFGYANFLLGYPSWARRSIARPNVYLRSSHFGFYWQDDFKISQRITLNYGLRYEYQTPWVDKFDRIYSFDTQSGSIVTAGDVIPSDLVPQVAGTLPIITAAQAGFPLRSLTESDPNNFSPRIGLAIRPFADATTVVRLGYGAYSQIWPGLLLLSYSSGGPWQSNEDFNLEAANQPTIQFPNPFVVTSQFSALQSVSVVNRDFPNERTHQWNVSIGRQIWGTAVDIGYVGTRGLNLPYTEDLNLLQPSTEAYSSARRPYARFNSVNLVQTGGKSIYHGLTVQADRRMANDLNFNVNYTWAKALTDVNLRTYAAGAQQNQYQRFLEWADDSNIRRQQLRFSYIYQLPVGKGRQFLGDLPALANHLLGGWQFSGITTMVTGQRLSPSFSGTDPANTNQWSGRPDRLADGNFDSSIMRDSIKNRLPIFDKTAFARPASGRGSYGNSARYILTGPGEAIWNLVLAKNFDMPGEAGRLQFRWEMFNAFNRSNFSNPNLNVLSSAFGLVTGSGSSRSMLFGLRLDY